MTLIRRLFRANSSKGEDTRSLPETVEGAHDFSAWFDGKEFSSDWTSPHFTSWAAIFAPLKDLPIRVLEIGSYEGYSALFFLNFFMRSSIVCIDPWNTSSMVPAIAQLVPGAMEQYPLAEGRFDRNLHIFLDRLTKIRAYSVDALAELGVNAERFDVVYVDGSHRRIDAYRDCTLSWPLLNPGGILLIDDYEFGRRLPDDLKPKQGVDAFLSNISGQHDEIHRDYQIAVRKH